MVLIKQKSMFKVCLQCISVCFKQSFLIVQIDELNQELTAAKQQMEENGAKVEGLTKQLTDREAKVKRMQAERRKHMEEVYEMKYAN